MSILKKILCLLVLLISFAPLLDAQKKKTSTKTTKSSKQKSSSKKTSSKKSSSKKSTKKSSSKSSSKSTASKKVNLNEADDIAATLAREALEDTSHPKEVVITSAFKPSLKTAAKINFTAATPLADTARLQLLYRVPAQNLFFSYQPVPIKPIAMASDSIEPWKNSRYVKVGVGNFSTPFAEMGLSFGDGVTNTVSILATHLSSKGNIAFQEFGKNKLSVLANFQTKTAHDWTAHAFFDNSRQYLYGFQPATIPYTKDDLLQRFNTLGFDLSMHNKMLGENGFSYQPKIGFRHFSDNHQSSEINFITQLPFTKAFSRVSAFKMGLTADIAAYKTPMIPNSLNIQNNLFYVDPSFEFKTPNLRLNLGVIPSWDNSAFKMLPNLTAEASIKETGMTVELGWKGSYQKNGYRTLAEFNPYIDRPDTLWNTRIAEQYLGLKGSFGNHFSFAGRVSFMQFFNQPLFVNTFSDGRAFNIIYDSRVEALRIKGELGYRVQEQFSLMAGVNITQYTKLSTNDKAYGLVPMELTGSLKWKLLKDLQIKADVYFRDGVPYLSKSLVSQKLDPAADLNLGAEFTVLPRLNIWFQMNNLLNNTYQRWNQYEVLGFNVLGGVVYSLQ
ncbi:MAG: hypothetical protein B7Y15_06660 [Bacteroidetes bacterium 24-39-8]|nr:MAG: hypothetical protein B7Y15_06660 [Bacteroidetes bacterium 24-39-8]OZA67763.1 MAG: hypothetical protein B7X72_03095 [Sphingobacteriia bacterium 39-39-8]HQR92826.1 hypothetical protein [Sediminibacterium sp.]HQS55892.1 hypothetical protein [Sediminibacterium sp.]